METLPHHALLLQETLICDQQVKVTLQIHTLNIMIIAETKPFKYLNAFP